jgi:ribonuclease J
MVKEKVRVELKRLVQKTTGRRPLILPVIMEV